MNVLKRIFKNETRAQSEGVLVIPRVEPGWNVNAESYFHKELKPLAGTEISVALQVVDEQDGGWDETNLLYRGSKVGQLPNSYHQRLATVLRELRSNGKHLECTAYVSKDMELKLLAPFPEKLIPFINGGHNGTVADLSSTDRQSIRVKESDKYQANLKSVWETANSSDWSGSVICKKYTQAGGKYDGQEGIDVFVEGMKIGSIGPRFVEDLAPILDSLERGQTDFECRISLSKFDDGKVYATLFA